MKTTRRRVLRQAAWDNNWLSPWVGFIFYCKEYKDGRKVISLKNDGILESINGYVKYFSKPLK